ncbi:E1-E2 ATPase family protein (macronuclear) [Tetrahymena thermophila SB210]|uniref:E1-E2 ATPase family protein n=1 Tax=Tetrahymena thermophila (strain SB210) TaxID=312017 RepID=Q240K5_TETTS|nr:E1-E2 ATPase family protein [Tetrahymena thermophila SB210]EAS02203.1 E1-E2 ATPase family protein [Tetrahymena thermophila SB210]|eukprot:XP_001022448.1 E1-E2 ATPase family protein [Tetrahymena thermophila SB210]
MDSIQDREHLVSLQEISLILQTDFEMGLKQKQVEQNLKKYGENVSSVNTKSKSFLMRILLQQLNLQNIIFWICGLLSIVIYLVDRNDLSNLYIGIIIIIIIVSISKLTDYLTQRNNRIQKAIQQKGEATYVVMRDNKQVVIQESQITIGDIMFIQADQRIPADARVIEASQLEVNQYALTGETLPVKKGVLLESQSQEKLNSQNLLFAGAIVVAGVAKCVVFAVGKNNLIYKLGKDQSRSFKNYNLNKITTKFIIIALISATISQILLLSFTDIEFLHSLQMTLCIIFIFIPFTLQAKHQIYLQNSLQILQDHNILIRDANALKNAANITCLCADYGALVKKRFGASHIWHSLQTFKANANDKQEDEFKIYQKEDQDFQILYQAAIKSQFNLEVLQNQRRIIYSYQIIQKNLRDYGLYKFLIKVEDYQKVLNSFTFAKKKDGQVAKLDIVGNYSLVIVEEETENSFYTAYLQGQPQVIIKFCSYYYLNEKRLSIDEKFKEEFKKVNEQFQTVCVESMAFAKLSLNKEIFRKGTEFEFISVENLPFQVANLDFCGQIAFSHDVKSKLQLTFETIRKMDIKTVLLSETDQISSLKISQASGIIPKDIEFNYVTGQIQQQNNSKNQQIVFGGKQLASLENNQNEEFNIQKLVKNPFIVFHSLQTQDKGPILSAFRQNKEIIATISNFTGETEYLKYSQVPISMGLNGSDKAKEQSLIILLDDEIKSIIVLIREARNIQNNLAKIVSESLSLIWIETIVILSYLIFQLPLPLSSLCLLAIEFISDILPTFNLANAKPKEESKKMCKKQLNPFSRKAIINSFFSLRVSLALLLGFACYFYTFAYFGFDIISLFGITKIDGYKPPINIKNKTESKKVKDPYFNDNLYQIAADCTLNEDQSNKLKFEIDWFDSQFDYDLRNVLLKCDPVSKKWSPSIKWDKCQFKPTDTIKNPCYTTHALFWAQASFLVAFTVIFFTMNLIH